MTYEEDVREALKQGPGSVRQIVDRIPRASENGVRRVRVKEVRKAPKTSKPTRVWEAVE